MDEIAFPLSLKLLFCFLVFKILHYGCVWHTDKESNPVTKEHCKMFNLAFLSGEIKEDKKKSTALAKSISSCFCIETASYAAHQNASRLTCCL